jgi:shikimate kinase
MGSHLFTAKHEHINIVLIGMPGSGKSSLGALLARALNRPLLDTDTLIESSENATLQKILDLRGYDYFLKKEEEILVSIQCTNHIIATGGSAIYSDQAMNHLKKSGIVVLLYASLATLRQRISNYTSRGVAKQSGHSFADLYHQRQQRYNHYADITIETDDVGPHQLTKQIIARLTQ